MKTARNNYTQDEIFEKLSENPFISSFDDLINFYQEIPKFGKTIEEFKKNENYPQYQIIHTMLNYARIYEQFRPINITQSDSYWGTVVKMDGIYHFLFDYLGVDLPMKFSRFPVSYTKISKKIKHNEIDWDGLITDIKDIDRAILITMEKKAVDLFCLLGENSPFFTHHLVEGFILRYSDILKNVIINKEDIVLRKGSISIKGKEYFCMNNHQLSHALFELKNKKAQC